MKELHDNVIEFATEEKTATLTLHKKKYVNRIKKLAKSRPDEVELVVKADGTISATIPRNWIVVSPTRKMTDEEREQSRISFLKNVVRTDEI